MRVLIRNVITLLLLTAPVTACMHVGRSDAVPGSGLEGNFQRFEYTQVHMGVQARIVLYAPDTSAAQAAARDAFDRIAELDAIMSDYRPDSELMELVQRAGEGPVRISDDLFAVLQTSQRLARASDGAFDVTIGPVVQLWRTARREARLPDDSLLAKAMSRSGWHRLRLDAMSQTASLETEGMLLDLGGIAKGYAADEAVASLRASGIHHALIEFGGDIVASAPPPDEPGWRVTVPLSGDRSRELVIAYEAVSTSGDAQQFVEIDGRRYSHVVDPRSGIGLTSRIAVTVVAPRGVLSDALATALSIMGPEEGSTFLEREFPDSRATFRFLE